MEARSIDAKMVTRRCLVARLRDVTMAKYHDLISQNAGALLILLPVNLTELSSEDKEVTASSVVRVFMPVTVILCIDIDLNNYKLMKFDVKISMLGRLNCSK